MDWIRKNIVRFDKSVIYIYVDKLTFRYYLYLGDVKIHATGYRHKQDKLYNCYILHIQIFKG